jgi:hypothetical protein
MISNSAFVNELHLRSRKYVSAAIYQHWHRPMIGRLKSWLQEYLYRDVTTSMSRQLVSYNSSVNPLGFIDITPATEAGKGGRP